MSAAVTVTYYLEIVSSWCHWVEPVWSQLKNRYGSAVDFRWKVALMNPADFPSSAAQCDWFYQRSGTFMGSAYKLNTGWFEAQRHGDYRAPNYVAEAAKDFLPAYDDRVRLALTHAALRDGRKIGDLATSVEIAARAGSIDALKLRARAESPEIRAQVEASTAEFHVHQINQRPAFVLTSAISDKAIFSGLVTAEPLTATIDAMLAGAATYASYRAHFGTPPAQ